MVKKFKNLFYLLIFVGVFASLCSCGENDYPHVLIIAIEQLNSAESVCHRESNPTPRSGFEMICNESIRATHAYLPSTAAVPNLTSLLTGLYPFQHQVRFNSLPGLKAEFMTAAEVAWNKNYQTAFFSGGLTFLRRSGLHQGFNLFEDSVRSEKRIGFRPLKETGKLFLDWIQEIGSHQAFFSVITASDLLYPNQSTTNYMGETRSLTFESQLDEIDEALFDLFQNLQRKNLWDHTLVILTGVSGKAASERDLDIPDPMNLHSESTQVVLMMKPPYGNKDVKSARTIDNPVSLADVGRTIFDFLDPKIQFNDSAQFPIVSLKSMIQKTLGPWSNKRILPIEATWLKWQNLGEIRWAFFSDQELIMMDARPKVYNTLTDRLENHPLELKGFEDPRRRVSPEVVAELQVQPWKWPHLVSKNTSHLFISKEKNDWSKKDCFKWSLFPQNLQLRRDCQNTDFELYMNWILAEDKSFLKEQNRELFLRRMRSRYIMKQFKESNIQLGGLWEPLPIAEIRYDELDEVLRLNEKARSVVLEDLEKMKKQLRQDSDE